MKSVLVFILLNIFILSASATDFPESLRGYPRWKLVSPSGYSVPKQLAILCVAPVPPPTQADIKEYGPHALTYLRVFVNPIAEKALSNNKPFPEGSIIVKEKVPGYTKQKSFETGLESIGLDLESRGLGVAIKHAKGYNRKYGDWEFSYFPSAPGSSFESCGNCHRSAPHDFVFMPYRTHK